jgi:hypothetical protein
MANRQTQTVRAQVTAASQSLRLEIKTKPGLARIVGIQLIADDPAALIGATVERFGIDGGQIDGIDNGTPAALFYIGPDSPGDKFVRFEELLGDTIVQAAARTFGLNYVDQNKAGTVYPYTVSLTLLEE